MFCTVTGCYRENGGTVPARYRSKYIGTVPAQTHLSLPSLERINFAANRNCTAQTSRHDKFRHNVREHMARVTSYTVLYSPALKNSCCSVTAGRCGIGEILRRKTRARRASRRETRDRRARDWRVGLTPASAATTTSCDSGRLAAAVDLPSLVLFSCSLQ